MKLKKREFYYCKIGNNFNIASCLRKIVNVGLVKLGIVKIGKTNLRKYAFETLHPLLDVSRPGFIFLTEASILVTVDSQGYIPIGLIAIKKWLELRV
jgi:hypothetical protein